MKSIRLEDSPLASEQEYDSQIAHTIWELERTVKHGRASDATRRALIEAHASQLQLLEERYGVPSDSRSFLLLQKRIAPGLLMLPAEGVGCEGLRSAGRFFNRAGLSVPTGFVQYYFSRRFLFNYLPDGSSVRQCLKIQCFLRKHIPATRI